MDQLHWKRIGALLAVFVLAAAGCGDSSSSTTTVAIPGTIVGKVTKGTSAVAGASVTPSGGIGPVVTGSDGRYSINVPPGSYTLAFRADGLEPATSESVTVAANQTVTVDQNMTASALAVTVNLPAALRNGGPAGFGTTVEGIGVSATVNGEAVAPDEIAWSIADYDGIRNPPAAVTPNPASGATTAFAIPDFQTVLAGANAWMNDRYGTTGTDAEFAYIQTPPRHQLLSFGTQQARAMSFKVKATVRVGSRTTTGSAVVYPVTISSGANTQPLGMMVVANAPPAETYAWTLEYVNTQDAAATAFGAPPAGVELQGATTKNPYLVPTVAGVYKLTNGDSSIHFRVSTYHGSGKADTDQGSDGVACADCHKETAYGDYRLTDKFTEWSNSAHANHNWKDPFATPMTLVEFGLRGLDGPGYSANCIGCHTVGFSKVPSANNKGFDDVAAEAGWTFPATLGDEAWATVSSNDALRYRAGIQCESCHGPLEPTDHSTTAVVGHGLVAPVASMDSGICLTCHDALTHHDRGALWATTGHAKTQLAIDDATVEARGASAAHCGRCHAGEGFVTYLAQQQRGVPTNIAKPACTEGTENCVCATPGDAATCFVNDAAFLTYLSDTVGLKAATVHSVTCQTCHDPHSTELRLEGDTARVAAGFNYRNAGTGAMCIVCHNSRISAPIYSDSEATGWSAPHVAAQGDIFAGRNAYFFGLQKAGPPAADSLPNKTAHAFMANACADCHVKWVPEDVKAQFKVWNTNHTFKASMKVCSECHAEGIGERVAEQVEEKMAVLRNRIGMVLRERLNRAGAVLVDRYVVEDGAIGETKTSDPTGGTNDVVAGSVRGVDLTEFHGQPAIIVTLNDGTKFGQNIVSSRTANSFKVPGTTTDVFAITATAGATPNMKTVAQSFYNYLLLHGGAAEGVHNPAYVNGVLDATIAKLPAGFTVE